MYSMLEKRRRACGTSGYWDEANEPESIYKYLYTKTNVLYSETASSIFQHSSHFLDQGWDYQKFSSRFPPQALSMS